MLRITRSYSADAAGQYFDNALRKTDYYVKEMGVWGGRGAEMLGIKGEVKRQDFLSLANNRIPGSGARLTQRMNEKRKETRKQTRVVKGNEVVVDEVKEVVNRRAGYDFTFSVPKSVSVYLALNDDKALRAMIGEALADTMQEIEKRMEVRVRKGYLQEDRVSPNLVYAYFTHTETRPIDGIPDPHYHVHVFVMNATYDEVEKEWKAIQVGNTVGDRVFYEAHFDNALATRMEEAGYAIRRTENFFELASVSRGLVEKFSKRTKKIADYARDNYRVLEAQARALMKRQNIAFDDAFAIAVSEISVTTREKKTAAIHKNSADLIAHWRTEMTPEELDSLTPERVKSAKSENLLEEAPAKELAIQHLFEHVSLRRELHVAGMLLRRGLARVSLATALDWFKSDARFVRPNASGRLLSTKEVQADEIAMIRMAAAGAGKYEALGKGKEWEICDPLVAASADHRKVVTHVLGSRDLVTSFRGPAGAGKTELSTEVVTAIGSLSHTHVTLLAPSSSAVEELKREGFGRVETFQKFEFDRDLQKDAKGGILWVDEAGFLSVRQLLWIERFARDNQCRLIVAGDTKQHHGVEWGDALRILEESGVISQAVLTKIYRQRVPELREAIEELSKGKTAEGFDKLDKFGVIQEFSDDDSRLSLIAEKQLAAWREGKSSLIIAPTHEECRAIACVVRATMKKEGLCAEQDHSIGRLRRLNLTDSQQRDATNYEAGQVVEFHRIARGVGKEKRFKSGEQWEVLRREEGSVIVGRYGVEKALPLEQAKKFSVFERETIQVAAGDRIRFTKNLRHRGRRFLNNEVRAIASVDENKITFNDGAELHRNGAALHIDQGIAVTSHASQGKTVDQVIVSVPVRSFSQTNEAQFYVSMSRARYAMHLFTDSKVALREAVARPSKRLSAWELAEGAWKDRALQAAQQTKEERAREIDTQR